MNFRELQTEAHAIAVAKGWYDTERTFGDRVALVHSELSEALGAYRERGLESCVLAERARVTEFGCTIVDESWVTSRPVYAAPVGAAKYFGVASELADVVIRVADMAEWYGVENLQEWIDSLRESDLSGITTFGEWITCCHLLASKAMEELHQDANDPEHGAQMAFGRLGSLVLLIQRMAAHWGIDLDAAIAVKMKYNRTWHYPHGGNAL